MQICSAAIQNGPEIYGKVAREMGEWMDSSGIASIEDVRGQYLRNVMARNARSGLK